MSRPPSRSRGPGQVDVARLAGVSTQTVSRVIAGSSQVRQQTAQRVLAAVEELGYRVHGAAASLASGRTHTIGVVLVSTARYSSSAISVGLEGYAASAGYTVTTAAVPPRATNSSFIDAFERLERQGAEGIVFVAPIELDDAAMRRRTERTPTVHVERHSPDAGLVIDQLRIGRLATEHLLDLGHATVWHVTGDEAWLESRQRREGWEQALRERGIEPPPVIPADWSPESGYRAGRTIAAIPDATAVFAASDEIAFGLIRALHEARREVPGAVSVVSVDDIALAAYASPALTTVRQPFEEVGRAAAARVIAQIEGRPEEPAPDLALELVVRASTAPPPQG